VLPIVTQPVTRPLKPAKSWENGVGVSKFEPGALRILKKRKEGVSKLARRAIVVKGV